MPLNLNKLSALAVTKLSKPGYYGDGGGLWLQVAKSDSKSWIFRFKATGRQREMGLGGLRTVDLAKARTLARECRSLLLDGKDPIEARKAVRLANALQRARSMTFDQCAAAYIDAYRKGWENAKPADQWKNTLATYASPIIGALPVADVDTDLVAKVLSPIWATKTETATRVRGRIESVLDWATVSRFRQGDNPARWRGHLENAGGILGTPILAPTAQSGRTSYGEGIKDAIRRLPKLVSSMCDKMLPLMALSMSASVGFLLARSRAVALITWPLWQ